MAKPRNRQREGGRGEGRQAITLCLSWAPLLGMTWWWQAPFWIGLVQLIATAVSLRVQRPYHARKAVFCSILAFSRALTFFLLLFHASPQALEKLLWTHSGTYSQSLDKQGLWRYCWPLQTEPSLTKAEQKHSCSEGNLMGTLYPFRKTTIVTSLLRPMNSTATGFKNNLKITIIICMCMICVCVGCTCRPQDDFWESVCFGGRVSLANLLWASWLTSFKGILLSVSPISPWEYWDTMFSFSHGLWDWP